MPVSNPAEVTSRFQRIFEARSTQPVDETVYDSSIWKAPTAALRMAVKWKGTEEAFAKTYVLFGETELGRDIISSEEGHKLSSETVQAAREWFLQKDTSIKTLWQRSAELQQNTLFDTAISWYLACVARLFGR